MDRVNNVIKNYQLVSSKTTEPDEIWVAVGSGTLLTAILNATKNTHIYGVQVGANVNISDSRVTIIK